MSLCQQAARQSGRLGARKRVIVVSAWRPPPQSNQLAASLAHRGPVCRCSQQGRRCSLLNAVFYSQNKVAGGGIRLYICLSVRLFHPAGATAFILGWGLCSQSHF